jgi:uncharacterized membrane protein YeaQ/YmgE (transglycosylase-associated protein family)
MTLVPGNVIAWIVVGIIAGWLAGLMTRGHGFGLIGDLVVGLVGAFLGGLLFSFLLPGSSAGLLGSVLVAFIGAVILVWIVRSVSGGRAF